MDTPRDSLANSEAEESLQNIEANNTTATMSTAAAAQLLVQDCRSATPPTRDAMSMDMTESKRPSSDVDVAVQPLPVEVEA